MQSSGALRKVLVEAQPLPQRILQHAEAVHTVPGDHAQQLRHTATRGARTIPFLEDRLEDKVLILGNHTGATLL